MSNYYDILEIPRTASQKEVRQAYRGLARLDSTLPKVMVSTPSS